MALPNLQADLVAIDRALKMHDIRVDTECIPSIAPRRQRPCLPHGGLTRALLQFLRESEDTPLSTDELTMMLLDRWTDLNENSPDSIVSMPSFTQLRYSIHSRMKNLAKDKIVIRAPRVSGSRTPRWLLFTGHLDS